MVRASILHPLIWSIGSICMSSLLSGCSGDVAEATGTSGHVDASEEAIVRGATDDEHPGVVGVISWYVKDYTLRVAACSGTYVAPRLVLTAAHCLPENRYGTRVYYGSDLKSALEALGTEWYTVPPPDSPWAVAESFKAYAGFDKLTYFGDIAAVSLDRELPVPPTPIARSRLKDCEIGELATVVGFGATSSDELLLNTEGWGLKRAGRTAFLGSPAANLETDHPGIGLDSVRRSLALFDGRAPYANPCAGDSGGPVFIKRGNKSYVVGVSTWTGFYCENYSLYTRIDPFLDFLESSIERAGRGPVTPEIECARPLADGRMRVYFGYDNANDVSLDIPRGEANRMPADTASIRPTHFAPGRRAYAMAADYAQPRDVFWKIRSPGGDVATVSKHTPMPACAPDDFATVAADACLAMAGARCDQSMWECVSDLQFQYDPSEPAYCPTEFLNWTQCQATLPPAGFQCDSSHYAAVDVSETCMDAQNAYFICLFFGPSP